MAFDWGSLIGAGLGLFGQSKADSAAGDAAQAQVTSAAIAAEAAKFKPYGVTTGFGSSWFNPEKGTAGYNLDPALAAYRDQLMQLSAGSTPTGALNADSAAQNYMKDISGMGGTTTDIANRYAQLAGQAKMPTNIGNAYSGVRQASYSTGISANMANQYAQAGSNLLKQDTPTAGSLYNQIRDMQRPEEDRQRASMEQGLFGSGRMGMKLSQYGGTPEQLAFEKALGENRNSAAYQAVNQADQLAASQRSQAMQMSQMGLGANQQYNALQSQRFQNQMGLAGANLQAQQAQAQLFANLQQGALGAYGSQLQQGAMARAGGMSEYDAMLARGQGLFTSAMGVEELGLNPLQLGAAFGAKQASAGGAAGNLLMTGAANAGKIGYQAGQDSANFYAGLGNSLAGLNWG